MNNNKVIVIASVLMMLFFSLSIGFIGNNAAKNDTFEQTEIITSKNENAHYDFGKEAEKDGKKYRLADIKNEVLSSVSTEKDNYDIIFDDIIDKNTFAPEQTIIVEGKEYVLNTVNYEDKLITGRKEEVSDTQRVNDTYDNKLPKTMSFTYVDPITNEEVKTQLPFASRNIIGTRTATVRMPMRFIIYDSDWFVVDGENVIPKDHGKPQLSGYEEYYIKVLGVDKEIYAITDFEWSGAEYELDGVKYRNANAIATKKSFDYMATYSDTIELPDCNGYTATVNYKSKEGNGNGLEYTINSTGVYHYHNVITQVIIPAVLGIGAVLVLILYTLSRKRKEESK